MNEETGNGGYWERETACPFLLAVTTCEKKLQAGESEEMGNKNNCKTFSFSLLKFTDIGNGFSESQLQPWCRTVALPCWTLTSV